MLSDYRQYRNKTQNLIRKVKIIFLCDTLVKSKDSKLIWKHLSKAHNKTQKPSNKHPSELKLRDLTIIDSEAIATKLNDYFPLISQIMNKHNDELNEFDKLKYYISSKVLQNILFASL